MVILFAFAFGPSQAITAPAANAPPAVRIVYPYQDGGLYRWPAFVKTIAEAADPDGAIEKVEFFANGKSLGVVTNSPYVLLWQYGDDWDAEFSLTARAYDDGGTSTDSAPVPIFIAQDPSSPRVVLAEPVDGAILSARKRIRVVAKAYLGADVDMEVQVLSGTNILAQASEAPYQFSLGPLAPGEYALQARVQIYGNPWSLSSVTHVRVQEPPFLQPALTNGQFQLTVAELPTNQAYAVQVSSNLVSWRSIKTNTVTTAAEYYREPLSSQSSPWFYRIVALPPSPSWEP